METSAIARGRSRLRLAVSFFAIAVLCHFLLFLVPGLVRGRWRGEMGGFFVVISLFFALGFPTGFLFLWFMGLPLILLVSRLCHLAFGGTIARDTWQATTCLALWPLPYAFGVGSVVYMAYFHFGGWPGDVIYGGIGNALGAWCYLTIFWAWYRLKKANKSVQATLASSRA